MLQVVTSLFLVGIVLLTLKLAGVITWSWSVTTIPFIASASVPGIVFALVVTALIITEIGKK